MNDHHFDDLPPDVRADAETLWEYNCLNHELRPCDVAIGLGSHDLGVATRAAELFQLGLAPLLVFSGATAPTTKAAFPHGEAEHYREHAIALGVPQDAVLVEPKARNTQQNIEFVRELLLEALDMRPRSVLLVSRPYQQRRAFATARLIWPEVDLLCTAEQTTIRDYVERVGDVQLVLDMLVGDTQRIIEYPHRGFALAQDMPTHVDDAYRRLVAAGFTHRLIAAHF